MSDFSSDITSDSISFSELAKNIKTLFKFILKKWFILFLLLVCSVLIGFIFKSLQTTKYSAKINFIVEDGKSGSGGLSGIAGQIGLDIGSLSGNSTGIFSGDNILIFLKSNELCKNTLLSKCDSLSSKTLADVYIEIHKLQRKWRKKLKREINFNNYAKVGSDRIKDSLIQNLVDRIVLKQLIVERLEKKSTFISVEVKSPSELFSKLFCERLVQNATNIYIQIKTKRQKSNIDRLQRRADSIASVLNNKTYMSAFEQEKILDLNPGSRTASVVAEVSTRDKMMLTTLYGEVIKNLEVAKIGLNQEMPIIQVVDSPTYPLKDDNDKYIVVTIFLMGLSFISWALFFITKFLIK